MHNTNSNDYSNKSLLLLLLILLLLFSNKCFGKLNFAPRRGKNVGDWLEKAINQNEVSIVS